MTEEAKDRALEKLLRDSGVRGGQSQRMVTSTNGKLTVNGSPRIARKKGQRRRPDMRCLKAVPSVPSAL